MPMTLNEMAAAIAKAEAAGDKPTADWMRQEAMKQFAGTTTPLSNLNAGITNFVTGGKQLIGMGPSDDELKETRVRNELMAKTGPGGEYWQMAGEMAPGFLMPARTGAKVLQKTLGALRGAPAAAPIAARMSLPMAAGGAALESTALGAFTPTLSNESTLGNMAISGVFGAGVPVLGKALGAGYRGVRDLGERALAAAPGQAGERAAQRVGERMAAEGLERSNVPLDPARYAAQDYQPLTGAPREFAPSTAAAYHGTPELAAVEKATRQYDAPSWATRDAGEQAKRWEHLDTSLRGQRDVDAAIARADTMDPPYSAVGPRLWESNMAGLTRDLEAMVGSPAYIGNPVVQGAIDTLRKRLDMGTITPETLHELRKSLTKGLIGPPGASEAAIRAGKNDPHLMRLVERIDSVMENSIPARNRGAWGDWRREYSENLAQGEGAKAEQQMRRAFVDEYGRPLTGGGPTPDITYAKLQREADAARTVQSGPRVGQPQLTPQAEQAVSDILADLNATGIVQRVTKAATLGGSATAHNLAVMGMTGVLGELMFDQLLGGGAAGLLVGARARGNAEAARRAIMTRIMQDPAQFRQFVAASAQRAQQMARHQGVSSSTRSGAIGAGAALPFTDPDER